MAETGAGRAAGLFGADRGETKAAQPSVDLKALGAKIGEADPGERFFREGAHQGRIAAQGDDHA